MDDFAWIETFIKVVESGSFSAAARATNSSISSVARQVQMLEKQLGIRLLNRTTRSLSLTEPGRRFHERVSEVARELSNAKSEASSFSEEVKGELRVSLRVSTGPTFIVPALSRLLAQYPHLRLDISLTDERADLVANNIDVAVWMGVIPDTDLVARRLSQTNRIICGSPDYFQSHGMPCVPADLAHHNCLRYKGPSYGNVWKFEKDGEHQEVAVDGNLRTANGAVLLGSALAGLGLVMVHEWMARLAIENGQLVRALADYRVSPGAGDVDVYVVYPSSRGMSRKVRIFVDFLVDLFDQEPAILSRQPR
ncbi:LysR family transcriptional regulator [Paraburkholderia sp. MM5384-R2]|uniref:LysR family transcriptional regulator n=1 Tax=Paraburkholderia sp. MM5384-R2 TaxID=2723097 RepID=UPI001612F994|nr:LysR family transcriptional regulator [Paraburkholderia sp. MM5384-R2]MBB5498809.1 DNA-binding transcriptional LysR family regulator [Paraburkholderia sp. MM5384-R2]